MYVIAFYAVPLLKEQISFATLPPPNAEDKWSPHSLQIVRQENEKFIVVLWTNLTDAAKDAVDVGEGAAKDMLAMLDRVDKEALERLANEGGKDVPTE